MKSQHFTLFVCLLAITFATRSFADAVPVKININELRCIQTNTAGEDKSDQVYVIVTGFASGKAISARLPEKSWKASAKEMPVSTKSPATVWSGKLGDGEFVAATVTLIHGTGAAADAVTKAKTAADAKVAGLSGKTLKKEDLKKLATALQKSNQAVVKGIAKVIGKEHYGGMFDVIVVNNGGKLAKRATPVGLTAGQHYGTDVKTYTKIKYTRDNVLVKDPDDGSFYEIQLGPVADDKSSVRIKMLETELTKVKGADEPARNVTDYLVDVRILNLAKGKKGVPLYWTLGGEQPGPSIIHDYWNWAE